MESLEVTVTCSYAEVARIKDNQIAAQVLLLIASAAPDPMRKMEEWAEQQRSSDRTINSLEHQRAAEKKRADDLERKWKELQAEVEQLRRILAPKDVSVKEQQP